LARFIRSSYRPLPGKKRFYSAVPFGSHHHAEHLGAPVIIIKGNLNIEASLALATRTLR
jgi:hypothetical protein